MLETQYSSPFFVLSLRMEASSKVVQKLQAQLPHPQKLASFEHRDHEKKKEKGNAETR